MGALALCPERQSARMSNIKNGPLDQYGTEPFEPQQFGTAGVEGVNISSDSNSSSWALVPTVFVVLTKNPLTPDIHKFVIQCVHPEEQSPSNLALYVLLHGSLLSASNAYRNKCKTRKYVTSKHSSSYC